jgi:hypothetical protein
VQDVRQEGAESKSSTHSTDLISIFGINVLVSRTTTGSVPRLMIFFTFFTRNLHQGINFQPFVTSVRANKSLRLFLSNFETVCHTNN